MFTYEKAAVFVAGLRRRRSHAPRDLQVEFTNVCDWECGICPRHDLGVPERHMSRETVANLARNLDGVRFLGLCGWGETLLHPHLVESIATLRHAAPALKLRLTTNAEYLTPQLVRDLARLGVDAVSVSLDATDGPADEGHPACAAAVENLRAFSGARRGPRPNLMIQTTMRPGATEQIVGVVELAGQVGATLVNLLRVDTQAAPGRARPGSAEEDAIIRAARAAAKGRVEVLAINAPSLPLRLATHDYRVCLRTLFHAYVDVDGNVAPCCKLRGVTFGNLAEKSLGEIWRSPAFARFFASPPDYCRQCDVFTREQK
jgi:MoaA/NifB/PqqE/SkfB family radical SAM enzyme